MVRLAGFASINADRRELDLQQTLEAQEARVIEQYEVALREIKANNHQTAEVRSSISLVCCC